VKIKLDENLSARLLAELGYDTDTFPQEGFQVPFLLAESPTMKRMGRIPTLVL